MRCCGRASNGAPGRPKRAPLVDRDTCAGVYNESGRLLRVGATVEAPTHAKLTRTNTHARCDIVCFPQFCHTHSSEVPTRTRARPWLRSPACIIQLNADSAVYLAAPHTINVAQPDLLTGGENIRFAYSLAKLSVPDGDEM